MSDPITMRFINEAKKALGEIAEEGMNQAKSDPFEHGLIVGKYRGVQYALNILEDVLSADHEQELKS